MTTTGTVSNKPDGSLGRAVWVEFPVWLAKFVPSVASSFTDGQHLLKWKPVAGVAPFLAVLAGVGAEWFQVSEVFSTSWIVIILLASIGLMSVQLGAWSLVGYVAADLVTGREISFFGRSDLPEQLDWAAFWVSAAVEYLLLAIAVVGLPMVVVSARLAIRKHRLHETIGVAGERVVHVGVVAVGSWMWCQLVITSIRTVFTFGGWQEKTNAIFTAQEQWPIIVVGLASVAVARVLIESAARCDGAVDVAVETTVRFSGRIRPPGSWWRKVPAQIIIGLLLLGGIIDWWWQAIITSLVYLFVAAARHVLADTKLSRWLARFPILLRIGIAFALSFVVLTQIVGLVDGGSSIYNITPGRSFFLPWLSVNLSLIIVGLATIGNKTPPGTELSPDSQPPEPPPPNTVSQPPTNPCPQQTSPQNPQPPLPPPGFAGLISVAIATVLGILLFPNIAAADNCSGLGDCFDTQSALLIALAVLLIVLAVALVVVTAPVSVPAIAGGGSALALTGGAAALTTAQFATYVAAATAITIGTATIVDQTPQLIEDINRPDINLAAAESTPFPNDPRWTAGGAKPAEPLEAEIDEIVEHAFPKHSKELPEVDTPEEMKELVEETIENATEWGTRTDGSQYWYDELTDTVVVKNPPGIGGSTWRPGSGR